MSLVPAKRRRSRFAPSSTAESACALRAAAALERDPALRGPDDIAASFLGGLRSPALAKHRVTRGLWLLGARRRVPGAYTAEIVRVRFMDEILRDALATGLEELVILGAGFDSRPYRFVQELQGVRVIEADRPAIQKLKRAKLRQIYGREPAHVQFVQIDLAHDDLDAVFSGMGHTRSAFTLVIWCGVSPYLPEEAVARVLGWVGGHEERSMAIAFDALWAEAIDGSRNYYGSQELRNATMRAGETMRWGISDDGQFGRTLSQFGLTVERSLRYDQARASYLRLSDGTSHERPHECGILVHATAAAPNSPGVRLA
jgi:methyltransferase (TIGR00027 family)